MSVAEPRMYSNLYLNIPLNMWVILQKTAYLVTWQQYPYEICHIIFRLWSGLV